MNSSVYLGRWTKTLGVFLSPVALAVRLISGKEDPLRWRERLGIPSVPRPKGEVIWIHGASVGEVLSALPLVGSLRKRGASILLTSGTRTSAQIIQSKKIPGLIHQQIPLEGYTDRFLEFWKPRAALWLESELWPGALVSIKKAECPLFLVNGRLSPKSAARWEQVPKNFNPLSLFDKILVQSRDNQTRFRNLGFESQYVGNLKRAAPPLSVNSKALETLRKQLPPGPLTVAASTHPGEEEQVLEAWCLGPRNPLILIPRHPHRGLEIARLVEQKIGIQAACRSQSQEPTGPIYIADTLGEMGLFYRLADTVIVGGSWVPGFGGHNFIEPAHFGCAIVLGPYMHNFADLTEEFIAAGAALQPDSLKTIFTTPLSKDLGLRAQVLAGKGEEIVGRILDVIGL